MRGSKHPEALSYDKITIFLEAPLNVRPQAMAYSIWLVPESGTAHAFKEAAWNKL